MRPFLTIVALALVPTAAGTPRVAGTPPPVRATAHAPVAAPTAKTATPGSYAWRMHERRLRAAEALAKKHEAAVKRSRLAPADEYFGHMKISVIEIGNRLKDVTLKVESHRMDEAGAYGSLKYTIDGMQDWTKKYPHDTWAPRSMFALERLYAHFSSPAAKRRAIAEQHLLVASYPGSREAKFMRAELAAHSVFSPSPLGTPFAVAGSRAPVIPTSTPVGAGLPPVVLGTPTAPGTSPLSAPSGVPSPGAAVPKTPTPQSPASPPGAVAATPSAGPTASNGGPTPTISTHPR